MQRRKLTGFVVAANTQPQHFVQWPANCALHCHCSLFSGCCDAISSELFKNEILLIRFDAFLSFIVVRLCGVRVKLAMMIIVTEAVGGQLSCGRSFKLSVNSKDLG